MNKGFRSFIAVSLTIVLLSISFCSISVQASKGKETSKSVASSFLDDAKKAGETAKEKAGQAASVAAQKASEAGKKANEAAGTASSDAKEAGKAAKEQIGKAASAASEKANEAASAASSDVKKAGQAAKKEADKATANATKAAANASSAVKEAADDASVYAGEALESLSSEAKKASKKISNTAKSAQKAASAGMATAAGGLAAAADSVDTKQIEQGWEFVSKLAPTTSSLISRAEYDRYVKSVSDAIETMRVDLNNSANNSRGAAQEKGFIFEKWHADTYNIDAVSKKLEDKAWRLESNEDGSIDILTSDGESASGKAYKDGVESAKRQAERSGNRELLDGYQQLNQEMEKQGKGTVSFQDYVDNYLTDDQIEELFEAKYDGQTRLIPADQMDNAVAYLEGRIDDLPGTDKMSKADAKRYKETLDNLKDHMGEEGKAQSKPLSSDDLQALTEMAKDGDVDLDQFDIKVSNYISRSEIINEVLSAGASAAVLQVALTIGPDVYKIIVESLKSGKIDEKQLKQLGIDAALAGAGGFAEGSVSQAILVACKAGKFGKQLKNVSPDTVGTVAVLTVDAAKYAYMLYQNEITPTDYANLMAEETFVAVASQASGAALQMLLPMVPFAYLAGSMAGGMLASAGYDVAKDVVVEVKNEGGLSAILPEGITDGVAVGKEAIAKLKPSEIQPELVNLRLTTTPDNQIKISQVG